MKTIESLTELENKVLDYLCRELATWREDEPGYSCVDGNDVTKEFKWNPKITSGIISSLFKKGYLSDGYDDGTTLCVVWENIPNDFGRVEQPTIPPYINKDTPVQNFSILICLAIENLRKTWSDNANNLQHYSFITYLMMILHINSDAAHKLNDYSLAYKTELERSTHTGVHYELRHGTGILAPDGKGYSKFYDRLKLRDSNQLKPDELVYGYAQCKEHAMETLTKTTGEYAEYWSKQTLIIQKITNITEDVEIVSIKDHLSKPLDGPTAGT